MVIQNLSNLLAHIAHRAHLYPKWYFLHPLTFLTYFCKALVNLTIHIKHGKTLEKCQQNSTSFQKKKQ